MLFPEHGVWGRVKSCVDAYGCVTPCIYAQHHRGTLQESHCQGQFTWERFCFDFVASSQDPTRLRAYLEAIASLQDLTPLPVACRLCRLRTNPCGCLPRGKQLSYRYEASRRPEALPVVPGQ